MSVQVMRLIDKQRDRPFPFFYQFLQFPFTLFGYLNHLILGQVVKQGANQRSKLDAVFFYRKRFGDDDLFLLSEELLLSSKRNGFPASDNAADGHQPTFFDGPRISLISSCVALA